MKITLILLFCLQLKQLRSSRRDHLLQETLPRVRGGEEYTGTCRMTS